MKTFTYPQIAVSIPGVATAANQATEISSLQSIDSKTPALGQQLATASQPVVLTAVQVAALTPLTSVGVNNFPASQAVTGTFFQTTQPVSLVSTTITGTVATSSASLPLPAGAATSANQTTGNSSLSSIDAKAPALGQALAAASVPIVLTAVQLSALIPFSSVTANAGTNLNTSLLALDSTVAKDSSINSLLKPASTLAAVTTVGTITNALPTGSNVIGALVSNQTVNAALINGVAPLMGNGVTGTGSQRVTVASDNTPFGVVTAPSAAAANALSSAATTALTASLIVKASAGRLYSFAGYNSKASAQFIQIFNSATLPADAAVPIYSFTVPASSNWSYDFPLGRYFSAGITVCNSSTQPTKTLGSADCWFNGEYA